MIFGRTDLILSGSRAKFDAKADFQVPDAVAPRKPHQKGETRVLTSENFADFFFVEK